MKFNYKIENETYKVTFCPDNQDLKIIKNKNSYMQVSKDLKKFKLNNKILLVIDKNINNKIIKYIEHDLKKSYPDLKVLHIQGSKKK